MVPRPHTFSGVSQRRGAGRLYLSTIAPPAPLAQVVTSPTTLPTGEVGGLPEQDVATAQEGPSGVATASGAPWVLGWEPEAFAARPGGLCEALTASHRKVA